jgi:hypothetical protein
MFQDAVLRDSPYLRLGKAIFSWFPSVQKPAFVAKSEQDNSHHKQGQGKAFNPTPSWCWFFVHGIRWVRHRNSGRRNPLVTPSVAELVIMQTGNGC